jgi:hypothetical protein
MENLSSGGFPSLSFLARLAQMLLLIMVVSISIIEENE